MQAALAAARERGQDVASVPIPAIAAAAGISRSTLLRRLGGSRTALDEAVRAAGVDPGGRPPVRERAVAAGARLISERGIGAVTLDAVAEAAECSLPSLHTVFDGRDGLFVAIFERYGPILDLERLAAEASESVEATVRGMYRALIASFDREPRVLPAVFAEMFGRPDGPVARMFQANFPRLLHSFGSLLLPHVQAGRLRPLPLPLLVQQLLGPLVVHMMLRPVMEPEFGSEFPTVGEACEVFTRAFLRAVALTGEAGPTPQDMEEAQEEDDRRNGHEN